MATEVVAERTRFAKVFQNPSGGRTARIATTPVHYQDASGAWLEIDTRVKADSVNGGLVSGANSWRARFRSLSKGVEFDPGDGGGSVAFAPDGAADIVPVVESDGSSVLYENAFPDVDIRYRVLADRLKEEIVLKSKAAATAFAFSVDGVSLQEEPGKPGRLRGSRAGEGRVAVTLPEATVEDVRGVDVTGAARSKLEREPNAAGQVNGRARDRLRVGVDPLWLQTVPAPNFPITIDPTTVPNAAPVFSQQAFGRPENRAGTIQGTDSVLNGQLVVGTSVVNSDLANVWRSVVGLDYAQFRTVPLISATLYLRNTGQPGSAAASYPVAVRGATSPVSWCSTNLVQTPPCTTNYSTPVGVKDIAGSGDTISFDVASILLPRWKPDFGLDQPQFALSGAESPGHDAVLIHSQKNLTATLDLTFDQYPAAPPMSGPSVSASSPWIATNTPQFSRTGLTPIPLTDADGDQVTTEYLVCPTTVTFPGTQAGGCISSGSTTANSWTSPPLTWLQSYYFYYRVSDGVAVPPQPWEPAGANPLTNWSSPVLFVPALGTQTADNTTPYWFGYNSKSATSGSVDTATGNYRFSEVDAAVATAGPALRAARTYNSSDTNVAGSFGQGWTTDVDLRVNVVTDPLNAARQMGIAVRRPDGRTEFHGLNPDGTYARALGYSNTIGNRAGGGWTMSDPTGIRYDFDAGGTLIDYRDASDRMVTVSRTLGPIRSVTLTDVASGRTVYMSYGTSGRHVVLVRTQAVAANGGALTWQYSYTGDLLTKVCDARNPDLTLGLCTLYSYDAAGRLAQTTKPGQTAGAPNAGVQLAYDTAGRVAIQRDALGNTWTYTYTAGVSITPSMSAPVTVNETKTVDPRGYTVLDHYAQGSVPRLVHRVNELGGNRWMEYDNNSFVSAVTDENSRTTRFTNDAFGNVLSRTDARGAVWSTTWEEFKDAATSYRFFRPKTEASPVPGSTITYTNAAVTGNRTATALPATPDQPTGSTSSATYSVGTEPANVGTGTLPKGLRLTSTDERGQITRYGYDATGDLRSVTDPVGLVTAYVYDEIGRPTQKSVSYGTPTVTAVTTYAYDQLGHVTQQTDPAVMNQLTGVTHQRRVSNTYDGNGNLRTSIESDVTGGDPSRTTTHTYDADDRELSVTDAAGGVTSRTYDASGNVASVQDAEGRVRQATYNGLGKRLTLSLLNMVDDPIAGSAPYALTLDTSTYDTVGNQLTTQDALGRKHQFAIDELNRTTTDTLVGYRPLTGAAFGFVVSSQQFDAAGRVTHSETGNGLVKTDNTYDTRNRLLTTTLTNTDARAPGASVNQAASYQYDAGANRVSEIRTGGGTTERTDTTYDNASRAISSTVRNGASNHVTVLQRDQRGAIIKSTDPRGNTTATPNPAYTITYDVDPAGNIAKITKPAANIESTAGTVMTLSPVSTFGFDTYGNPTTSRDERNNTTSSVFDVLGRRTAVTYPTYTTPDGSGTIAPRETWTFDRVGNQLTATDRRNATTTYTFDKLNRVVKKLDPDMFGSGFVTRYAYDRVGNPTSTTNEIGATTEATFDDLDRLRTSTEVVRGTTTARYTTTYDYDGNNKEIYVKTPKNEITQSIYSPAGELLRTIDPLGKQTNYTYDLASRPVDAVDPLNRKVRNTYDAAGRRTTTAQIGSNGVAVATTGYGYDLASNQTSVTSPNGFATTLTVDALNRLTQVTQPVTATTTMTASYGYDAAGNNTRVTDGKGQVTGVTYNPWNLVETRTEPATTAQPALTDRQYTNVYDAGGLLTRELQPGASIMRTYNTMGWLTDQYADTAAPSTGLVKVWNFDNGVDSWFGAGGLTSWNTSGTGNASGTALTLTSAGASFVVGDDWPGTVNVTAGATYSVSASVKAGQAAGDALNLRAFWFNSSGTQLSSTLVAAASITDTSTAWAAIAGNVTAPAGATSVALQLQSMSTSVAGRVHYLDDVTITGAMPGLATRNLGSASQTMATPSAAPYSFGTITPVANSLLVITASTQSSSAATTAPDITITASAGPAPVPVTSTQWTATGKRQVKVFAAQIGDHPAGTTFTLSAGTNLEVGWAATATSITGYDPAAPLTNIASVAGTTITTNTPVGPSSLLFAALSSDEPAPNPPPVSPAAGWTELSENTSAQPHLQTETRLGGGATTSFTGWTATGSATANPIGVAFEIAALGATKVAKRNYYDRIGRTNGILHPGGRETFTYDDRDLLTGVTGPTGTSSFTYDEDGRMVTRSDAAGTTAYTYTTRSELATVADPLRAQTVSYTWNDASQVTSVGYGATTPGRRTLTYDAIGRLSTDTLVSAAGATTWSATYGYDANSNVTSKTVGPAAAAGAGTNTYTYDRANRITGWTSPANTTTPYGWDNAGNRTSVGATTSTYDQRNRALTDGVTTNTWTARGTTQTTTTAGLTTATNVDAFGRLTQQGAVAYTYDDLDRVAARNTKAFTYSGLTQQPTTDGGTTTISRSPTGNPVAIRTPLATKFVARDRHGDLTQLLGADGVVSDSFAYDPFGTPTARTGASGPIAVGYQGDWTDPATALVNMGARWYKPSIGRFVNRDTNNGQLSTPVSLNRYTYANNNPLTWFDPDGHACQGPEGSSNGCGVDLTGNGLLTQIPGHIRPASTPTTSATSTGQTNGGQPAGQSTSPPPPAPTAASRPGPADPENPCQQHTAEGLCYSTYATDAAGKRVNPNDVPMVYSTSGGLVVQVVGRARDGSPDITGDYVATSGTDEDRAYYAMRNQCPYEGAACLSATALFTGSSAAEAAILREELHAFALANHVSGLLDVGATWNDPVFDFIQDTLVTWGASALLRKLVTSTAGASVSALSASERSGLREATNTVDDFLGAACRSNSFVPGTKVLMDDGSKKAIETVKVGDRVRALDPQTGQEGGRVVAAVILGDGRKDLVEVTLRSGGDESTIVATAKHPFWVADDGQWIDAADLEARDRLLEADGSMAEVVEVTAYSAVQRVHNLNVDGIHTYFVVAGGDTVLVHNCGSLDDLSRAAAAPDRNGLTAAGRAAQKHGSRAGSAIPTPGGTTAGAYNELGQTLVDDLLTAPSTAVQSWTHPSFGQVTDFWGPSYGVRYGPNGEFIGFLDP